MGAIKKFDTGLDASNSKPVKIEMPNAGQLSDSSRMLGILQNDTRGFERLAQFLKTRCGIDLPTTPKNLSLMASRLRKVLEARGLPDYDSYADLLEKERPADMNEFISALTTNTTHFFREAEHFKHLAKTLPVYLNEKKSRELRVWCAASSTGQEPYTILMTILETGVLQKGVTIKFLATDIDLQVLDKAARAVYREEEIENVPSDLRAKYFEAKSDPSGGSWFRIKPSYASQIRFARLNLMQSEWPFQHKFDIVFCRNVLIYFDGPTAQLTVDRMASYLNPGGFLYIGHSECGHVRSKLVKTVATAVYQRLPYDDGNKGSR